MRSELQISAVRSFRQILHVRKLFEEYADELGVDLCFQNFAEELSGLPGSYAPPRGALLIAKRGPRIAGCVALRNFGRGACEMKRLYVRPAFRCLQVGRTLAEAIILEATKLEYRVMRLDTLARLKPALALYESLGFRRTRPYYANPLDGVVFLRLKLPALTQ